MIKADRTIVLQDEYIVQNGSYKELIGIPGLFQDLATRKIAYTQSFKKHRNCSSFLMAQVKKCLRAWELELFLEIVIHLYDTLELPLLWD